MPAREITADVVPNLARKPPEIRDG